LANCQGNHLVGASKMAATLWGSCRSILRNSIAYFGAMHKNAIATVKLQVQGRTW